MGNSLQVASLIPYSPFPIPCLDSFARRGVPYWLSPLADAPAVLRVVETMARGTREWRGAVRDGTAG